MCSLSANQKFYDTSLSYKELSVLDSELEELTAITKLFHSLEDAKFRSLLSDAQVGQTRQEVKAELLDFVRRVRAHKQRNLADFNCKMFCRYVTRSQEITFTADEQAALQEMIDRE